MTDHQARIDHQVRNISLVEVIVHFEGTDTTQVLTVRRPASVDLEDRQRPPEPDDDFMVRPRTLKADMTLTLADHGQWEMKQQGGATSRVVWNNERNHYE